MKKLIKLAAVSAVFVLGAYQAHAMDVNWSAETSNYVTLVDEVTPLPEGDFIAIGLVTNTAYTLSLENTSAQAVENSMEIWASSTVGVGTSTEGSFAVDTTQPGAGFFSGQIYLIAVNATTVGAATQVGVFTDSSWVFPASDAASPVNIDLSDAGSTALIGSIDNSTVIDENLTGGGPNVNADALHGIVTVPEPSTIALVGMGLLGAVAARRRTKKA